MQFEVAHPGHVIVLYFISGGVGASGTCSSVKRLPWSEFLLKSERSLDIFPLVLETGLSFKE